MGLQERARIVRWDWLDRGRILAFLNGGVAMRVWLAGLALVMVAAGGTGCRTAGAPAPAATPTVGLRSPWDATPKAAVQVAYDCGPTLHVSPDIAVTGAFTDKNAAVSESVKQAVYAESSTALKEFSERVVRAADFYQSTGSALAAACVVQMELTAANEHAMAGWMASDDAVKEQNKALRAASIAYLKVRPIGLITADQQGLIVAWMTDIVRRERDYYDALPCGKTKCGKLSHRGLEEADAAVSVGIVANDHTMFYRGLGQYREAVQEIDARGMLPYDTRGRYALKFHLESAAALVQIAEFGEDNGEPMYGYDHGRIHLLIRSATRGIVDSGAYAAANSGKKQVMPGTLEPWEIGWASLYVRRFPDPVIAGMLQQIGNKGADEWGGSPWGAEES